MIYLFWGPDSFSIQVDLNKILEAEQGATIVNLKEPDTETLSRELLTDSFFEEKKIVVIKELLSKVAKEKKEVGLKEILEKAVPTSTIVFIESSEPKGVLKKYFLEKATVKQHVKLPTKNLVEYVKNRAQELGSDISPLAAERFVSYVGSDFWQIDDELKKLSLYVKDNEMDQTIDITDVDELVRAGFEANIFELMDAISQKNTNRAIALLDAFLDSGENEIYILTMIARQFRNIAMAKAEKNITEATLAKKAGIHPFVAKKSIMQARNFDSNEIMEVYGQIVAADLALKSGQNPKQTLQSIILN